VLLGLDHVILAVRDPDVAAGQLSAALGLPAGGGGRHEAHGTRNRLLWLGDAYIELMGVFDARLAARSWWGRHAQALMSESDAAYMGVALASDDVGADAERLRAVGSALDEPESGERSRPDGRTVRWRLAHAATPDRDLGLAFLIEHDPASAEWTAAERAARAAATSLRLRRLELPVADMRAATVRLHRDLGVAFRPSLAGGGARDGAVGAQTIRLLRRGQSPRVILAGGPAALAFWLLGCDWQVEPAVSDR
jgi:hypothetical protein